MDAAVIDPSIELRCADATTTADDGYHFAGSACGGCHDGARGGKFGISGTMYMDTAGSGPLAGITVHAIDASGAVIEIVTALNGNFWSYTQPTLPITTYVSSCPDVTPMPTQAGSGDCNGCHAAGQRIVLAP
jgi:hypothetical protein